MVSSLKSSMCLSGFSEVAMKYWSSNRQATRLNRSCVERLDAEVKEVALFVKLLLIIKGDAL